MEAFEMPELDPQPRDEQGHGYVDFLASEKLSVGLSVWPAGSVDRQQPHGEDEVYYIISGRGFIRVADEDRAVKAPAATSRPRCALWAEARSSSTRGWSRTRGATRSTA